MFGRPVVRSWRNAATQEITVENDQGKQLTLTDEHLRRMYKL